MYHEILMNPMTRSSGIRWLTALTVVALVHVVASAKKAEAACGDYVRVRGQGHSGSALNSDAGQSTPAAIDPQENQQSEKRPCDGPACSNQDRNPFAPTPTTSVFELKQPALAGQTLKLPVLDLGLSDFCDNHHVARPDAAGLFRPPREGILLIRSR
jgi:hypothetical protein